jgi:hypothetical protein
MRTTIRLIPDSKIQRERMAPINCLQLTQHRHGLAFFGTPHAGGNDTLVSFGRSCANIVNAVTRSAPNDLMEAVSSGSLYTDILQETWRHQLNDYRIISFYEGVGNVSSASFTTFCVFKLTPSTDCAARVCCVQYAWECRNGGQNRCNPQRNVSLRHQPHCRSP